MVLNACDLETILKYISCFDDSDRFHEGVEGKSEEEIIKQYIESFKDCNFFEIDGKKGFVILEKKDIVGGFHLYLKKEFRSAKDALDLLLHAIAKLKEFGCSDIYTLANGKNSELLQFTKRFKKQGEYKGFGLYQLKNGS